MKQSKNISLIIAEVFYSLQCEGREIGTPAVFLRLGGCNLLCKSETWICDTIEVWQKGKRTDFSECIKKEWVERLREGAHLVITGGEPLLHQVALVDYMIWFYDEYTFWPFIEVETNGTIIPWHQFACYVNWWNVCPKLSNSGMPWEKRFNSVAINYFKDNEKCIFKFVVANDGDIQELLQDWPTGKSKVYLMPAGATREELDKVRLFVAGKAILLGVNYSERLHIVIWDKKTGV